MKKRNSEANTSQKSIVMDSSVTLEDGERALWWRALEARSCGDCLAAGKHNPRVMSGLQVPYVILHKFMLDVYHGQGSSQTER